jgi:hypothetical protein
MSEGSVGTGSSNDQPDGVVYESGSQRPGGGQEDGQPVGAADVHADRVDSGAGGDDDSGRMDNSVIGDSAEKNTYDPLDDDVPLSEDGQGLGAADRDADVDRTTS